jgi:uncharacterized protein YkwD
MMKRVRLVGVGVFAWSICLLAAGVPLPADKPSLKLSPDEQKLLDLTNQERKKANLPPLQPNPVLFAVARSHTANMVKQSKREHVLDGKDVFQRLDAAGYQWASAAENLATSYKRTLADVMKGWMASKSHRANILKPKFKEIGIGVMKDAKGVVYCTQVFGLEEKD